MIDLSMILKCHVEVKVPIAQLTDDIVNAIIFVICVISF